MFRKLFYGPKCEFCNKYYAKGIPLNLVCNACFNNDIIQKLRKLACKAKPLISYESLDPYSSSKREGNKCIGCGSKVEKNAHSVHHMCAECVPLHPDDSHDEWWRNLHAGGWNVGNEKTALVKYCKNCGGVLVLERDFEKYGKSDYVTSYRYYKKGERNPVPETYYCTGLPKVQIEEEQSACKHDFITILKPITKTYKEYLSELRGNEVFGEWTKGDGLSIKDYAHDMSTTKHTVKWCWKCGFQKDFSQNCI